MIYIGSDHAGFLLKEKVKDFLKQEEVKDFGCFNENSCDYPDIAKAVCLNLGKEDKAILVCGTGVGMAIVANKFSHVRAVCASEHYSVMFSRLHNNSNVLCIGARVVGEGTALELVDVFLKTEFERGRHEKRLEKIKI